MEHAPIKKVMRKRDGIAQVNGSRYKVSKLGIKKKPMLSARTGYPEPALNSQKGKVNFFNPSDSASFCGIAMCKMSVLPKSGVVNIEGSGKNSLEKKVKITIVRVRIVQYLMINFLRFSI